MTLITRDEFALITGESVTQPQFDALYAAARRVVSSAYDGPVDEATGRPADVVGGVLLSVMTRILSNPKGARQLVAGPASVTFGGSDVEVAAIFTLTPTERADLESVSTVDLDSGAFTIRPGR